MKFKASLIVQVKSKNLFSVILGLVLCLSATIGRADLVVLKNGQHLEGKILEETPQKIVLSVGGVAMTFSSSQVERVERTQSSASNPFAAGNDLFEEKKYEEAIQAYEKVGPPYPPEIQDRINRARDAFDQAYSARLDNLLKGKNPHDQYTLLDEAMGEAGAEMSWRVTCQKRLIDLCLAQAKESANHLKNSMAKEWYQRALRADPDNCSVHRQYATFTAQLRTSSTEEVTEIMKVYLMTCQDDITAGELFVLKVGLHDPGGVLLWLFPNGSLRADISPETLRFVPDVLRVGFQTGVKPPGAPFGPEECYEWLLRLKPDEPLMPLLVYRTRVSPESAQAHYDLGYHLLATGEFAAAMASLSSSLQIQPSLEARNALTRATEGFSQAMLQAARAKYSEKRPEAAQGICEDILERVPNNAEALSLLSEVSALDQCGKCDGGGVLPCKNCSGTGIIVKRIRGPIKWYGSVDSIEQGKITNVTDNKLSFPLSYNAICQKCGTMTKMTLSVQKTMKEPVRVNSNRSDMLWSIIGSGRGQMVEALDLKHPRCPQCSFTGVGQSQVIDISHPCSLCSGKGNFGRCQDCGGHGIKRRSSARPIRASIAPLLLTPSTNSSPPN